MKFLATLTDTDDPSVIVQDAYNWKQFKADNRGKDIVLDVRAGARRSSNANRYYWGVVIENIRIAMERDGTRITPEQLHGYFCQLFLPVTLPDANGEAVTLPGQTKNLSRKEFGEYTEAVVMWCWEHLNIVIPEPNSQTQLELIT